MLTQEQINNLKPGDPIVINGTVNKINEDGHILATCGGSSVWLDNPDKLSLPSEHGTSVPTPKYDPCRRLKCGDIVELVEWNGRFPIPKSYFKEIGIKKFRVVAEECRGIVTIDILGTPHPLPICFIKLNTPVEEIEPYIVYENLHVCAVMHRDEKDGKFIAVFFISHYGKTIARERAEAERDRLNAEWRKEHGNV